MHKPQRLKKGDKVGIIAPGAIFDRQRFETGIATIKTWGLVPVYDKNLFKRDFLFAGTSEQRYQALVKFLKDQSIKAIWCVRGGFGSYDVAEKLALKKPTFQSKPFLGLSDNSALHFVLNQKYRISSLHAPTLDRMGQKDQPTLERRSVQETLFDPQFRLQVSTGLSSLGKAGTARGILCGGNLALICSSIGTPWEIETRGKILFFEDIAEPAYRLDRMISQLRQAGKLDRVRGLVLGDFTDCVDRDGHERWVNVLRRHFAKAKFPVLLGLHSGHGKLRLPLPLGLKVEIKTSGKRHFKVLENYVD